MIPLPRFFLAIVVVAIGVFDAPMAQAEVVLDAHDVQTGPGSTDYVDVFAYSTDGSDTFGVYNLEYHISQIAGTSNGLSFGTQDDYYYYGSNSSLAPFPISSVSSVNNANDYIGVQDSAFDSPGIGTTLPVGQANEVQVARLGIDASGAALGDIYQVSLNNDPSTASYFVDDSQIGPRQGFSTTANHNATVAVEGAAVPEPAGIAVVGLIVLAVLERYYRRAKGLST